MGKENIADESLRESRRQRKPRHRAVELLPEVRFWNGTLVEVRERSNTNEIILSGTPIVFDTDYVVRDIFGEFTERMSPSVADDVLARGVDCRFLFNHDGLPLARTINGHTGGAGTMQLVKSETALNMTVTLDARQQLANDLMVAIERGDVAEMSCGFIVARDEWDADMEDRTIISFAELLDVSAVTYPCSPTTHIDVAQRMVAQMPVESRERVRKLVAVTRAGKMLSAANEEKIQAAHDAIGAVLDAAKPSPATESESGSVEEVRHPDGSADAPDPTTNADATVGGNASGDSSGGSQGVEDGTGSRSIPATQAERREAALSYNDQEQAVSNALCAKYGDDDGDGYFDIWVCDMSTDWVVFQCYEDTPGQGTWRVSYALDGDVVTLGDDLERVQRVTSYETIPDQSETSRGSGVKFMLEARKRRRSI